MFSVSPKFRIGSVGSALDVVVHHVRPALGGFAAAQCGKALPYQKLPE